MHQISVLVDEPRAADVFAYREWLFVLTYDCRLLAYSTSALSRSLESAHRSRGAVAAYALFSSKGIGASAGAKDAWKAFDHARNMTIKHEPGPPLDLGIKADSLAVLDMNVYYNSVYVATDSGTWSAAISTDSSSDRILVNQRRLTWSATESLSVGMGAVAASLGANGLSIYPGVWRNEDPSETRIERESLRSSLGWGRATNYPTNSSYENLEIDRQEIRGRVYLNSVGPARTGPVELPEGHYALWDRGRLLVADDHEVASRGLASANSRRTTLTSRDAKKRPLSVCVTGNGFIVTESSRSLEAGRGDESRVIHKGAVGSVRTFPASQRYRRLIAATVEGGFILSAVMRDDGSQE